MKEPDAHEGHAHGDDDGSVPDPPPPKPTARAAETGGSACQLDLELLFGEGDPEPRLSKATELLGAQRGISLVHLRTDGGRPEVCLHYDPAEIAFERLVAVVRSTGAEVAARYAQKTFRVEGMDCAQCAPVLEHALLRENGVLSARVAYASERLIVDVDETRYKRRGLVKRARALGFVLNDIEAGHHGDHAHGGGKREFHFAIASGALLALGLAVEHLTLAPPPAASIVYGAAAIVGGTYPMRDTVNALREKQLGIETLMIVAAVAALCLQAFFESALLLFLFGMGHALEQRAMARARGAIDALAKLRPEIARVRRNGDVIEVPVAEVRRGDRVIVRPGDRVPLDGTIVEGQSALDQSAITGESVPVEKGPGGGVFAGTVNTAAALEVEVTKTSGESALARIIDMVSSAEAQKSPTQRFTQALEKRFVPVVLLGAPLLAIARVFLQGATLREGLLASMSLLVASSPCALAIATPAAVLSAVARAARSGVLIKGGAHLETLGRVQAIAFDKTGTLTEGKPKLLTVTTFGGFPVNELLAIAAGAEALSAHPLAKAIVDGARTRGITPLEASDLSAIHGKGLRSTVLGRAYPSGPQPSSKTESLRRSRRKSNDCRAPHRRR
jgi:Cd2+/Zn2+-exporting ATPase